MKNPLFLSLLLLSACSLVPEYHAPEIAVPAAWNHTIPSTQNPEAPGDWWQRFGSPELASLTEEAARANTDLTQSLARIEQARATARIAGAPLLPDLGVALDAGRSFTNPPGGGTNAASTFRGALQASYEIDLFGRNRANANAASLAADAAAFDHDALTLVVTAETAARYLDFLTLADRIAVADTNLKNAEEILGIVQARYDAGTVSALELSQQKTDVANRRAAIASLTQQQDAAHNALAVLVGKAPQGFAIAATSLEGIALPPITLFQPAETLPRRPDIRAAEARLRAADFDIGAARAAFFPTLDLGLNAGVSALRISGPATLAAGIAATLAAPIFTGGALEGQLERATARQKEVLEHYRQTALISLREVEDALAAIQASDERALRFHEAAEAAEQAYRLSRQRFDAGIIDFQTLLDTQRALLQAQDTEITAREDRLLAAIDLYRVLGGGWERAENPA